MALVMVYKTPSAAPTFTAGATISGTLEAANVLTCAYAVTGSNGEVVRWYRHTADDGSDPTGTLIGEGLTYLLTSNENGFHIRVIVTATNAAGSETSTSAYTAKVVAPPPPEPPSFTSPVTISGTATVGSKLTVQYTPSNWVDVAITWTSYATEDKQQPVTLGTGPEYTLTLAEDGRWIGVRVVLTNAIGETPGEDIVPMSGVDPYEPLLPTEYVPPAYDISGMNLVYCNAGDNLQTKLDSLVPGDCLVVEAGVKWVTDGKLTFPAANADGSDWIYVISSDLVAETPNLPPAGTRVTEADAVHMPTISVGTYIDGSGKQQSRASINSQAALAVQAGARKVRFVGLEITTEYTAHNNIEYRILPVGTSIEWSGYPSAGRVGEDIIFDRCIVRGTATGKNRDGFVLYSGVKNVAIKECLVDDFKGTGVEAHAIHVFQTPGPVLIENNTIRACGINLFICDNVTPGQTLSVTPSDIVVRKNLIEKKAAWIVDDPTYNGLNYIQKGLIESKGSHRVLVEGNVLHRATSKDQPGQPWFNQNVGGDGVSDLEYRNNLIVDAGVFQVANPFDYGRGFGWERIRWKNNIFYKMRPTVAQVMIGHAAGGIAKYLSVENNTWVITNRTPSSLITVNTPVGSKTKLQGLRFRDNIIHRGNYGIFINGGASGETGLVATEITEYSFQNNVVVGSTLSQFNNNGSNWFWYKASNYSSVGFVDASFQSLDGFALAPTSPYYSGSTTGGRVGADVAAVLAAVNPSDIPALG